MDYSARRFLTIPLYRHTMFRDSGCSERIKPCSFNKIINSHWYFPSTSPHTTPLSSLKDLNNLLNVFSRQQLMDILQGAAISSPEALSTIVSAAHDPTVSLQIFVSGLQLDTTSDELYHLFSEYGEIEDARVILDRKTNQNRGYGFVTFKKPDSLIAALKQPSKRLNGNVVCARSSAPDAPKYDFQEATERTLYVRNVPEEMASEELVDFFSRYGEIEEGPRGRYDHRRGAYRSYCFFTYKTSEGVRNALAAEKKKVVGGRSLWCEEAKVSKKKSREVGYYISPEKAALIESYSSGKAKLPAVSTPFVPYVYLLYYYYLDSNCC